MLGPLLFPQPSLGSCANPELDSSEPKQPETPPNQPPNCPTPKLSAPKAPSLIHRPLPFTTRQEDVVTYTESDITTYAEIRFRSRWGYEHASSARKHRIAARGRKHRTAARGHQPAKVTPPPPGRLTPGRLTPLEDSTLQD